MVNNNNIEPVTYKGGCHCGAVRYEVIIDEDEATICNCSICNKKGFVHAIVQRDKFTLLQGSNDITTYTFNTGIAQHKFCQHCGIHSFYIPRSHPDCIDVNIRCFDGEYNDIISKFTIIDFDGKNWEQNIHQLK